ncbi:Fe(2+) transporter permease subunit FeoB [Thioflexithrix psekupsensis]|uniref:Ferrous iron transport protein B n=1 Tax=Thioflexithrix psekupsensis TaxID=1570016 RepID=A0A251X9P4_9GAMM|nr:Fe(2+) transporter permease subunit FeoB [Thioflexithrix psekupsensis]OUD15023.1 ferrous iron transport protein B [Thioflexithrix psekupsensis]
MSDYIVGVVGNPNCGKTTLFNALTGSKQRVGNWPGVTVDRKTGFYQHGNKRIELVDLPGIYSLDIASEHRSLDEKIAQDYLLSGEVDLILNIIDAANLERNLYLTTQLLEMGIPVVLALNMIDVVETRGDAIFENILSERLGIPVVSLSASKGKGLTDLRDVINQMAAAPKKPSIRVDYPAILEQALTKVSAFTDDNYSTWQCLKWLEGDAYFAQKSPAGLMSETLQLRAELEHEFEEDLDIMIADARYSFISEVVEVSLKKNAVFSVTWSDKIDKIVLNRWLGIPIFLAIMYLMFTFTITLGGVFIDFFDQFTGVLLVEGGRHLLDSLGFPLWMSTLLASGIGGGIQVVATFIPIIGFLYLFLSFLEDSGYMARAAFVMDRFMRFIGLPGKSFVPLIVGFGCNVPAIMATRTLENPRDRYMTVLMNPFMSCGARLPVYALFAAAFFPSQGQNVVFGLYLLGIVVAILSGLIMKYTLLRGDAGHFIMELPSYHVPKLSVILRHTWERLKGFVLRAGKIIVPMVVVISFLNAWGTDGSFGHDNTDKSVLSEIGRTLTPAFEPMGINEDNWPATVGLFTGVLAKEVIVGTLNAIYTQLDRAENPELGDGENGESAYDLWAGLSGALATIPENLSALHQKLLDPLEFGQLDELETVAEAQGVSNSAFGAMVSRFASGAAAFAYLLFILMYFPCVAATAAIYRETGARWTLFVVAWTTGLGYMSAVIFYQAATFSQHPTQSAIWIGGLMTLFFCVVLLMRLKSNPHYRNLTATTELQKATS